MRAKAGVPSRLNHCISIGERREGAYRLRRELLDGWGGLDVKSGYIQRSARLPAFLDASRLYGWFLTQKPVLIAQNNPMSDRKVARECKIEFDSSLGLDSR